MDSIKGSFQSTFRRATAQIMHLSMRGLRDYARREGFSMSQVMAMRHIYYKGACNVSEISERLGVTNAASSQMLDHLVRQGLILRSEKQEDRRNKEIVLTRKGQQTLRASVQGSERWLDMLADQLTPDEMKEITAAFCILLEKLPQLDLN